MSFKVAMDDDGQRLIRLVNILPSSQYRVMIPETENPQEAKSVYPAKPVRHD